MCRIAAYLGPTIRLDRFLLTPEHSLYRQSWAPRELQYATMNADGFGLAWRSPDGQPARYVQPMAVWNDPNLPMLARNLSSPCWLGNMRKLKSWDEVNAALYGLKEMVKEQPFVTPA